MIKAEWTNADALDLQPTCNQIATDLISRQAAIDALTHKWDGMVTSVFNVLKELPSAQPERKKGEWLNMGDFEQCSVCGGTHLKEFQSYYGKTKWIKTNYCPNCGADMRGEQE